jgi:uncharacterized C2H2 Zn-finger protein
MIPTFQVTYKSKNYYRHHIKKIHKIDLPLLKEGPKYDPNMKAVDTNNPNNTCCSICKLIFKTKQSYLRHIEAHKNLGTMQLLRGKYKNELEYCAA